MLGLCGAYVTVTLIASLLILVLWGAGSWIQRRYGAKCMYWLCLVVLIRLLLPLTLPSWLPPLPAASWLETPAVSQTVSGMEAPVLQPAEAGETALPSSPPGAGEPKIALETLLLIVWLTGAMVFGGYQAGIYLRFRCLLGRDEVPVAPRVKLLLAQVQQEMGISRQVELRASKKITSPLLCGWLRPVIWLPAQAMTEAEFHFILRHELVHLRRGDLWWKLGSVLAVALHWYNPLVHSWQRLFHQWCELSCDQAVVRGRDRAYRRAYGQVILNAAGRQWGQPQQLVLGLGVEKSHLKDRLSAVLQPTGRKKGVLLLLALVVAATLLTSCLPNPSDTSQEEASTFEPPRYQSVKQALLSMDYAAAAAELHNPYVGNHIATGKVAGLSLLNPYNTTGMELFTAERPYGMRLEYELTEENPFRPEELDAILWVTALNCFVLIDNLDQVFFQVTTTVEDGQQVNQYQFDRAKMLAEDPGVLLDDPAAWRQTVSDHLADLP